MWGRLHSLSLIESAHLTSPDLYEVLSLKNVAHLSWYLSCNSETIDGSVFFSEDIGSNYWLSLVICVVTPSHKVTSELFLTFTIMAVGVFRPWRALQGRWWNLLWRTQQSAGHHLPSLPGRQKMSWWKMVLLSLEVGLLRKVKSTLNYTYVSSVLTTWGLSDNYFLGKA